MSAAKETLLIRKQVSDEEWQMRVDLAACYRLIAMHGWDDLVFTHISARVPGPDEHFLINAYGLLFEEMTASSLIKVDLDGNKVIDSPYPVNPAGFTIHSAVHEARHDVGCVIHTHTKAGVAPQTGPQEFGIRRVGGRLGKKHRVGRVIAFFPVGVAKFRQMRFEFVGFVFWNLDPGENTSVVRAMIAIVEQADIPVGANGVEKIQQRAAALGKLETE